MHLFGFNFILFLIKQSNDNGNYSYGMEKNSSHLDMHFSGFCEPEITPKFLSIKNMLTSDSIFLFYAKPIKYILFLKQKNKNNMDLRLVEDNRSPW